VWGEKIKCQNFDYFILSWKIGLAITMQTEVWNELLQRRDRGQLDIFGVGSFSIFTIPYFR